MGRESAGVCECLYARARARARACVRACVRARMRPPVEVRVRSRVTVCALGFAYQRLSARLPSSTRRRTRKTT